jgi:hypothetical protein
LPFLSNRRSLHFSQSSNNNREYLVDSTLEAQPPLACRFDVKG